MALKKDGENTPTEEELKAQAEADAKALAEKEKPQAKPKKVKKLWYVAKIRLWHPFQNKHVDTEPVLLELDDWLQSQIDAGIVTEAQVED